MNAAVEGKFGFEKNAGRMIGPTIVRMRPAPHVIRRLTRPGLRSRTSMPSAGGDVDEVPAYRWLARFQTAASLHLAEFRTR